MMSTLQSLKTERISEALNDSCKKILMFELMPALHSPAIRESHLQSMKSLSVFNFIIRDLVSNHTYCYMWHEGEAIRGVNEICSCLMEHIVSLPSNVTSITVFSRAGHLTQNPVMSSMFLTCLQCHPGLLHIDHVIIPVPRLFECESQHEKINDYFQTSACQVNIPCDWYEIARKCHNVVIEMSRKFYFYQNLFHGSNLLVKPKCTIDGLSVAFHRMYWFQYTDGMKPFLVGLKSSYADGVPFKKIDFLRHGQSEPTLKNFLQIRTLHLLSKQRKEAILSVLHLLDQQHHSLYLNLHVDEAATSSDEELV